MMHDLSNILFCISTAALAITYRRYLIQEGGLLVFIPRLFYKAVPIDYTTWNDLQKQLEKVVVTCATCQAGQLTLWLSLFNGFALIDCLLCAGLASMIAHIVDQRFFA
jgi:hypothetical protein